LKGWEKYTIKFGLSLKLLSDYKRGENAQPETSSPTNAAGGCGGGLSRDGAATTVGKKNQGGTLGFK